MSRKPAQQLPIDAGPAYLRSEMSIALRRALGNAIASLTPAVAAGACGCTPQELCDAAVGRSGRRFPTEWAIAIAHLAGGDFRDAIIAEILAPLGLRAAPADEPEPDGPYIQRLEEGYAEFGELGRARLAHHRKAARRG